MYFVLNTVPIFVLHTFKLQEFHCMYLLPRDKLEEDKEFDVVGDLSELHAKPLVEQPTNQNGGTTSHQEGKGFNLYSQILEFL